MATGTIKKITDKGFGFISMEGAEDLFFHNTDCETPFDTLQEGMKVEFEEGMGPKGKKATKVHVVENA